LITTKADFEKFQWPDPDALDFSAFEKIGPLLPPKVKVVAILGKIFTNV
jgi:hypothetical protein